MRRPHLVLLLAALSIVTGCKPSRPSIVGTYAVDYKRSKWNFPEGYTPPETLLILKEDKTFSLGGEAKGTWHHQGEKLTLDVTEGGLGIQAFQYGPKNAFSDQLTMSMRAAPPDWKILSWKPNENYSAAWTLWFKRKAEDSQ